MNPSDRTNQITQLQTLWQQTQKTTQL